MTIDGAIPHSPLPESGAMPLGEFKKLRSEIVTKLDDIHKRLEEVIKKTDAFFQEPPDARFSEGKGVFIAARDLQEDVADQRDRLEPYVSVTPEHKQLQRDLGIQDEPEKSVLGADTLDGAAAILRTRLLNFHRRELRLYRNMMDAFMSDDPRHQFGVVQFKLFKQEVGEIDLTGPLTIPDEPPRFRPTDVFPI